MADERWYSDPRGSSTSRSTFERPQITGRLVFGLIFVALGAIWTLDNLGITDAQVFLRWWPALLVAFGVAKLAGFGLRRAPVSGGIFTVVGGWLLLRSLGIVHASLFVFWPVMLIVLGAMIVWRSVRAPGGDGGDASPYPRPVAIMGGITSRVQSQELRGAEASAVMGGVELDLRDAKPAVHPVVVDVFAWWGGIVIVVPETWRVDCEAVPVMGGIENSTRPPEGEPAGTLVVRGVAIMGGVEVTNKPLRKGVVYGVYGTGFGEMRSRRRNRRVIVRPGGVEVIHEEDESPPPSPPSPPPSGGPGGTGA